MSELHLALGDISRIRRQMARTTQFRGYGPATLAGTGVAAALAAGAQAAWVAAPERHLRAYLGLWIGTAVVSSAVAGVQIATRTRRLHSGLSDEMLRTAVEQFLPAVMAGVLVTAVLVLYAPSAVWMLPGLWQVIYSLGVFASCRFLPRLMLAAGAWYLLSGLLCLAVGNVHALAPWTMGVGFGVGQMLVAAILQGNTAEVQDEQ